MVGMNNILEKLDQQRIDFAQHHYTVLESIFLMSKIQKMEELNTVKNFEDYTRVLNNLMCYQAYAGRVRDNIEKCFIALGFSDLANNACKKLEQFYMHRHVFVHGKKIPFRIDDDNVFHIARPKSRTTDPSGAGKGFLWEEITLDEMKAADEYLEESLEQLMTIVNGLLEELLQLVKTIIEKNKLSLLSPPTNKLPVKTSISSSNIQYIHVENNSSASFIPPASGTTNL
jgi:hypothetical protein